MGVMASQITSLMIVYSTVYSGADQRKHQSSAPLAFVRGIHRWPVNFPHRWPVTRKMFPFDDVIMTARVSMSWRPHGCSSAGPRGTNPTMHQTHIPQCTTMYQKCAHVCQFPLQSGACGVFVWCIARFVRWIHEFIFMESRHAMRCCRISRWVVDWSWET